MIATPPARPPRLAVIADRRYLAQTMPGALIDALTRRGVQPEAVCADECRFDPNTGVVETPDRTTCLAEYDGVVARTRHGLGLVMLAYAEAHGVPTINSYAATERIRNKAGMAVLLSRAGLQAAFTVLAPDVSSLRGIPRERFPLILKPTFGDNSRGLLLVREPAELMEIDWREDLVLVQSYLPNDGYDLKLYVCGADVFAVRKPSPFNDDPAALPHRVEADAAMVDLARRCGAAFGLDIYGVDTIQTPDGLVVIEVNEFPNFSGLDEAPERLAEYVLERVGARAQGGLKPDAHRIPAAAVAA
jgi:glutathione synthase/RimK-type ligase-like ATP-grasp enzyme